MLINVRGMLRKLKELCTATLNNDLIQNKKRIQTYLKFNYTGSPRYLSMIGFLVRRHISRNLEWDDINRILGLHFIENLVFIVISSNNIYCACILLAFYSIKVKRLFNYTSTLLPNNYQKQDVQYLQNTFSTDIVPICRIKVLK